MRLGLILLMAACAGKEEEAPTPTVSFLSPEDGATVAAGAVDVTLIVENMTLEEPVETARAGDALLWLIPGRPAYAHNEGETEGYAELSLDGVVVAQLGSTQGQLTDVAAGSHTLVAELFYADGDALEPPVTATVGFTAEEGG